MTQSQKEELKESIKQQIEHIREENEKLKPSLYPLKKDCSLDNIAHQALKQEQTLVPFTLSKPKFNEMSLS